MAQAVQTRRQEAGKPREKGHRMTEQDKMTRKRVTGFALMLGAGIALAGCQESGGSPFGMFKKKPADETASPGDAETVTENGQKMIERDVEAPQVFSVDEKGLWDGRPSLGGVWVAHPNVKDPERVIIRNPSNGKFVIGALFKRETDNPGPKLQVSSDAADALGLLAGAPTELSVVALRRETVPVKEDKPAPLVDKPVIAAPEEVEQKSLDEVTSTAAAGIAKAQGTPKPAAKPVKPAIGAAPAPAPAPAAPVAAATPQPSTPKMSTGAGYIQIGIFSVEANAKRAQSQMAKAGVIAEIKKEQSHSKTFWRVIAGPAPTKSDLDALKTKIHGLGYPDAYPVSK